MARITSENVEELLAFGEASSAFLKVAQLVADRPVADEARRLFVELEVSQTLLRRDFARGHGEAVLTSAGDVLDLADQTTAAIWKDRERLDD